MPSLTIHRTLQSSLLVLVLALLSAPGASAQAFGTLGITATGSVNVNRTALHETWQPHPGAGLTVATPFYRGFFEAGATWRRFTARTPSIPRYDALFVYLGWGLRLPVAPRLALESTIRLGNYRMAFDEQTFAGVRNESEMALGAALGLDVRVGRGVSWVAGVRYLKAFTFRRIHLVHLTTGVRYTLKTPAWLRRILE